MKYLFFEKKKHYEICLQTVGCHLARDESMTGQQIGLVLFVLLFYQGSILVQAHQIKPNASLATYQNIHNPSREFTITC